MKVRLKIKNRKVPKGPHGKFQPREWLECARVGEWPNTTPFEAVLPDGTTQDFDQGCIQVITENDLDAMVNYFDYSQDTPTLIDEDHLAGTPGRGTNGSGYVVELVKGFANVDPSGMAGEGPADAACLWGKPRYSTKGVKAVTGGEFFNLSPVLGCTFLSPAEMQNSIPKLRPVCLAEVALTNRPNMNLTSISNALPEPPKPVGSIEPTPETKQIENMKSIAAKLGLPETATEAEILTAIQALQDASKSTATEIANMKSSAADAFVTANQARIPNTDAARAHWKRMHIQNSQAAEAMLGAPAQVTTQNTTTVPVFQPAVVTTPATPGAEVTTQNTTTEADPSKMDDQQLLKAYNSQPKGNPKAAFYRAHKARLGPLIK